MFKHDESAGSGKLMEPLSGIVSQHASELRPLLLGQSGSVADALKNDENVRKAAAFCYPLLPGLVRLAVKEPAFVDFVMNNREKVLSKLATSP